MTDETLTSIHTEFNFDYYLRLLEKQVPFTFCRWGDGEWTSLLGLRSETAANTDKHQYFAAMGDQLNELLLKTPLSNSFHAMQPYALRTLGTHIEAWLEARRQQNANKITWHHAEVWNKASSRGVLSELLEKTESYHRVIVGPQHLDKLPLDYSVVRRADVPYRNAFLHLEYLLAETQKIVTQLDDTKPLMFFVSCGMSAALFIDRLRSLLKRNFTALDMGSVFDPYCGVLSRSAHTAIDPAVLLPIEKYFDVANRNYLKLKSASTYRFVVESRYVDGALSPQQSAKLPPYHPTYELLTISRLIRENFYKASRVLLVGIGDVSEYRKLLANVFNVKEEPDKFVLDYLDLSASAIDRVEAFNGKLPRVVLPSDAAMLQEKYDLIIVNDVLRTVPSNLVSQNVRVWLDFLNDVGTLVVTPLGTPNNEPTRTYDWPAAGLAEARLGICNHSPGQFADAVVTAAEEAEFSILSKPTCYEISDNVRSQLYHLRKKSATSLITRKQLESAQLAIDAVMFSSEASKLQRFLHKANDLCLAEPYATIDRALQISSQAPVMQVVNAPDHWRLSANPSAYRCRMNLRDIHWLLDASQLGNTSGEGLYLVNVLPLFEDYVSLLETVLPRFGVVICHQICHHSAINTLLPQPRLFELRSPRLYALTLRKLAQQQKRAVCFEIDEALSRDEKQAVTTSTAVFF